MLKRNKWGEPIQPDDEASDQDIEEYYRETGKYPDWTWYQAYTPQQVKDRFRR